MRIEKQCWKCKEYFFEEQGKTSFNNWISETFTCYWCLKEYFQYQQKIYMAEYKKWEKEYYNQNISNPDLDFFDFHNILNKTFPYVRK